MNYLPYLKWHAECEGTAGLIDSIGALNFTEQNGVGESVGIIGNARDFPAANDAFQRAADASGPFDLRSQSVDKMTFCGWYKADSISGAQVFAEQTGTTEGEKAWAMTAVWQLASNFGFAFSLRDNTGPQWRTILAPAAGLATYPTGEWCFVGGSVSIAADIWSVWLYTQSQGQHFETYQGIMAGLNLPFDYSTLGVTWIGLNASGGSIGTGGMLGDADQLDMFHGIAFKRKDVRHFWNKGRGRVWPNGYRSKTQGQPYYFAA